MDNSLVQLLETSGFAQKEAQVYLALLELGQGTVTEISKITELKRSIIYVILEGLIKRGQASELPDKRINVYQATDPSVILLKLKTTTKNFSEMLPILQTMGSRGKKKPKIRYYDTKEGVWNVWDEMNYAKEAFFITSYKRIEDHFPGAIAEWVKKAKKGIINPGFRHLIADSLIEIELTKEFASSNQKVRTLPDFRDSQMDFTIFDNKLAITSLAAEPFIVVIESEELVKSMKPIFEIAWGKGKELKSLN